MRVDVLRLTAFSTDPAGGNPAGVWIGDELPSSDQMQKIAADVGYSETAFLAPGDGNEWTVRYYSPEAEVTFCGHATIASGVALGERFGEGTYHFATLAGDVPVHVKHDKADGSYLSTLVSVQPQSAPVDDDLLAAALDTLGWTPDQLDPSIPPAVAFAGAVHLVVAVAERETLANLRYDFDRLKQLMLDSDLTTLQLIWRQDSTTFHSRNPFPVGGVVEDPATGAAAAALGGYLRAVNLVRVPTRIDIHQGDDMGRPSRIRVDIPLTGGIEVSGTAVPI